ncbi:MAG: hypothetical protein EOM80_11105 [Erysipelotrichia bacterium]|nr:hypothetical protein [Candidatus Riflebacteria bacterium]NCB39303.1 hypothetical protein [Erysipelotrichia bacterium]
MSCKVKILLFLLVAVLITTGKAGAQMDDLNIVNTVIKEITDADGTVKLRIDWLKRPGEMLMTITYNGFLTQEGMVNFYIDVNGVTRDFMTMKQEIRNRAQRIKILSFHPVIRDNGVNRLAQLPEDTIVDSLLFRNAPYYKVFGPMKVEMKFFCHGRWDGDGNNNNENYCFTFASPITDFPQNHF